jgi:transposase, IS5 family
VARRKLVLLCRRHGPALRHSEAREGPGLSRQAGGEAHLGQFKRMPRVLPGQRTGLDRAMRDIRRKRKTVEDRARAQVQMWLARAERIWCQHRKDEDQIR